ncbi:MAG: DUF2797 domain-containing protein [Gammaproteobacteria bacterium]|nr:DUF2797 domain-containing protein [Gammaproteobacteria bacterium]
MKAQLPDIEGEAVQYELPIGDELLPMNALLGQSITLQYKNEIHCIECGRKTKKSFAQGYCYPCFSSLAKCDLCIMRPETCHYAAGTCRQPEWGESNCMIPHYVYLANSSGLKVGITRETQIPTRWIDQGASQALPILKVNNRLHSGLVEHIMKGFVSDRTDWRKMLKNEVKLTDLAANRDELLEQAAELLDGLPDEVVPLELEPLLDEQIVKINYPVIEYPTKVKSLNLEKTPEFTATLMGIKGQYLIFDIGVINMRKYAGYFLQISCN